MEVYVILFFNVTQRSRELRFYQTGGVWRNLDDAVAHIYDYADPNYSVHPLGDRMITDVWEFDLIYEDWKRYADRGKYDQVAYIIKQELL